MNINGFLNSIASVGIKPGYKPWEKNLVRKLNLCSLLGFINVSIALVLFPAVGYTDSIPECIAVLIMAPLVFLLNVRWNYIPAAYLFTFIGCFLFFCITVKLGISSYSFLYYFPLVIGLTHMLARREVFIHLVFILTLCAFSIACTLIFCRFNTFEIPLSETLMNTIRYINICFSFFTCIGFVIIVSIESIQQEKQLNSALHQKEVLLAELFHRVKNNLSIVTSLLNLKKNSTTSLEAQMVLEECRNLIYSMALVHTKIYNSNTRDTLNFKEYLEDLLPELINSIGGAQKVEFNLDSPNLHLSLLQAVPCGLIINELITNAFKHAQLPGQKLKITITLAKEIDLVRLNLLDNGPGRREDTGTKNSLGMELIKSLADQLEGNYHFENNNGLQFNMQFRH